MQIGAISITGSMRLVKDEPTCLTSFRISNYFNRPLPGYALSLFAEKIIRKYEILGDYDFESVALVFLQTWLAEADQNEELATRVEETLRLLVLWNQSQEVNNQLICHPNVFLTNLRNEIELNLSYIRQFNLSQYQQLYKLYSDEKAEQNLIICQTLIAELNASARTSADPTAIIREKQIIKSAQTIVETPTIQPHSLSKSFRTILASVRNTSHTPGNRELFYSSVRNQIIHHLIENRLGDIRNIENVQLNNIEDIINLYQSLWAGRVSAGSLQNQGQLLEHIQNATQGELTFAFPKIMELLNISKYSTLQQLNKRLFFPKHSRAISNFIKDRDTDQEEVAALSSQIIELMNVRKHGIFPRLNTQLISPEHSRTISHLIFDRGRLSPQTLSFLKQQSFTKSELFRIIEQGSRDEKVLLFEALNFAVEKIDPTHLSNTFKNSISTLSSLLNQVENNSYDFNRSYELDGTGSTLMEFANRQDNLVWNEIEKQVNQYRTTVSRQINSIGTLQSLLHSTIKNDQIITVLEGAQGEKILNPIGMVMEHTSADGRGSVSHLPDLVQNVVQINQNLKGSRLRNIKNSWLRSKMDLQYLIPQASASFTDNKMSAGVRDLQNPVVMSLLSRLNKFITSTRVYGTPAAATEKSIPPMQRESIVLPSSLSSNSLIIRHQPSAQITSIVEVTSSGEPSLQSSLPARLEKSLDIMSNPIFNIMKKLKASNMSSNFILPKVSNMIISPLRTQLLNKYFGSVQTAEINSLSRYLINVKATDIMQQQGDLYFRKDGFDYRNSIINNRTDIDNNAVMIMHTADQAPRQEQQNEGLSMPTQSELINRFGNLISNPDLPPAELIGRQPGRLLSDDNPDVLSKDLSITELTKKISLGEQIIREEQNKVTQIHQKIKEQEAVINNLNQAYDQLQEEMASRINERKIASMIMKELRAKLSLDKMRYGLQ